MNIFFVKITTFVTLLIGFSMSTWAQDMGTYSFAFDAFPTSTVRTAVAPQTLRLPDNLPENYIQAIKYGMEDGVNFGGEHFLVTFGCGSGCVNGMLISSVSGESTWLPTSYYGGFDFRPWSNLLVVNPRDVLERPGVTCSSERVRQYWLWNGEELVLLGEESPCYTSADAEHSE